MTAVSGLQLGYFSISTKNLRKITFQRTMNQPSNTGSIMKSTSERLYSSGQQVSIETISAGDFSAHDIVIDFDTDIYPYIGIMSNSSSGTNTLVVLYTAEYYL